MNQHYVTFGQSHRHVIQNEVFDKDCVAVFLAEDPEEGRALAFQFFGPTFSFEYHGDQFDQESMKYFPRGQIRVPAPVYGRAKRNLDVKRGLYPSPDKSPGDAYAPHAQQPPVPNFMGVSPQVNEALQGMYTLIAGMNSSWTKTQALTDLHRLHEACQRPPALESLPDDLAAELQFVEHRIDCPMKDAPADPRELPCQCSDIAIINTYLDWKFPPRN